LISVPVVTSVGGVRIEYSVEGTGPPLLFHVGAACNASVWRRGGHIQALSQSHTCVLMDRRGQGDSDHPRGAEANHIDRCTSDVIAVLDALKISSTAMWANGSGIIVMLRAAEQHPERFSCLIGSGTVANILERDLLELVPARIADFRTNGWQTLLTNIDRYDPGVPQWLKECISGTDLEPHIGWWESLVEWHWNPLDALPRLSPPMLLLVGELEDPDDEMAQAVAGMQRGVRVRVPGKGHLTGLLDLDFVLPYVTDFLRRHNPTN
jgi:pimeloyl-ACP methyl ester carboxylesterase